MEELSHISRYVCILYMYIAPSAPKRQTKTTLRCKKKLKSPTPEPQNAKLKKYVLTVEKQTTRKKKQSCNNNKNYK